MKNLLDELKKLWVTVMYDSPFGKPIIFGFLVMVSISLILGLVDLQKPGTITKVDSPQVSIYEINRTQTITGELDLLWDTPYHSITSPVSLVSEGLFTITLAIDAKLIDSDSTEYLYDIPYQQEIVTSTLDMNADGFIDKKDLAILKDNYGTEAIDINGDGEGDIFDVVMVAYNLDEPGTGLFSTINYTLAVPSTINRQTEEWIRPYWVVTSTDVVYLESTGEVFTSSLTTPIWYWIDWTNHLVEADNEGFYYNRTLQLDWAHRIYLPVIMKGK